MTLFRGIQEYIALNANNIALVFDSGNIVSISGNIFLYPPPGHPILYKCSETISTEPEQDQKLTDLFQQTNNNARTRQLTQIR